MAKPKIVLFVDIASPFCYMAFHVLQNSPIFKACDITYTPISLAGLMKLCGNKPPLQIKNKSDWLKKEHFRWARLLQVPLSPNLPPRLPLNTVSPSLPLHPDLLPRAIGLLYLNVWKHLVDSVEPERLHGIVKAIVGSGQAAEKVIRMSDSDEIKTILSQATLSAFREGAFGLPWLVGSVVKVHQLTS